MEYIEYQFYPVPFEPWNEIIVACLAEIGFESFMEEEQSVKAYVQSGLFEEDALNTLLHNWSEIDELEMKWTHQRIAQQNWNAKWEADFVPVYIEDKLSIVAPFHDASARRNRVIEIEPKMSFGTGHHQTTYLVCQKMFDLAFDDKLVLDMGTGTGVLAILAEQLGAKKIIAIDIEPWSIENTMLNASRNGCIAIEGIIGGVDEIPELQYDFILANINKNVLKAQLPRYAQLLTMDGDLLLSGFFKTDVPELEALAIELGFTLISIEEKETWALMHLNKSTL
jgi:ribosomal protein L11 methyltransferase